MKLYAYQFDDKLSLPTTQYDMKANKRSKTETVQVERTEVYEENGAWTSGTHT